MFSEALTIMDRNTALYMCEERKKEIAQLHSAIAEKDSLLMEKDSHIAALEEEIRQLKQHGSPAELPN